MATAEEAGGITPMTVESRARALVKAFAARRPLGAGSFIVTLYGDAIVPRGGLVWLGNVIAVCAEVGISETLVRTAVSRLVSAGHLEGLRTGRRSFYRLTEESLRAFDAAAELIYAGPNAPNGERWSLLLLPPSGLEEVERRELAKAGYGVLGAGLALRAGDPQAMDLPRGVLQFDARLLGAANREALTSLAMEAWPLQDLAERYQAFCQRFGPLQEALCRAGPTRLPASLALAVRLLLVHDYRHVVLDDPALPSSLLPQGWQGPRAQCLFAFLYRSLDEEAERAIEADFIDSQGPLRAECSILEKRRQALSALLSVSPSGVSA